MTGEALDQLSTEEKSLAVEKYHVFARVSPEQKYAIRTIERLIKTTLAVKTMTGITEQPQQGNFIRNKSRHQAKRRSYGGRFRR